VVQARAGITHPVYLVTPHVFPGCHLKDFGDLSFTPVPKDDLYNNLIVNPRSVGLANQELAEVVSRAVSSGYSCVTVGGDHR
jgi:arginase